MGVTVLNVLEMAILKRRKHLEVKYLCCFPPLVGDIDSDLKKN